MVISCLGTLNGLIMGSARGMFSIASRDLGPKAEIFKVVNRKTGATLNSAILGFCLSALWMIVWCGNVQGWWGKFMDISELPIAFLYVIYIAFCIWVMREYRDLGPFSRFLAPLLAATESVYITWGAIQKDMFIHFVIITAAIMMSGLPFMQAKQRAPRVRAEIAATCRYNRLDGPERKTD